MIDKDKYVKIMFDYCATAVWTRAGCNNEYSEYPISDWLKNNLRYWALSVDHFESYYMDKNYNSSRTEPFGDDLAMWGEDLARKFKEECSDYTVMFFNEAKYHRGLSEDEYFYEIALL